MIPGFICLDSIEVVLPSPPESSLLWSLSLSIPGCRYSHDANAHLDRYARFVTEYALRPTGSKREAQEEKKNLPLQESGMDGENEGCPCAMSVLEFITVVEGRNFKLQQGGFSYLGSHGQLVAIIVHIDPAWNFKATIEDENFTFRWRCLEELDGF
ncbi:hypothetical protein BDZ97DRAFT_1927370 [Flammula alnicola]|nr:hypothetical protein BDZ97DRAFT_1927370 [Flammula alnicola]